jgi:copper chaperone CopZ
MTHKLTKASAGVKHHLPHRTRLKVPAHHRDAETMNSVKSQLEYIPGVKSVQVNQRTGSIVVDHDERDDTLELMGEAIQNIAEDLFHELLMVEEVELPGLSIVAHFIRKSLSKADSKVAEETSNVVDLKVMVPLLFFGAGVVKSVQSGSWWGEVPSWVLFYFAYDSYMKFHGVGFTETLPLRDASTNDDVQIETKTPRRISGKNGH